MSIEPKLSLDEAKAAVATKTAPRVTEESIKAKIADVAYYMPGERHLTVCVITMKNGFSFTGTAAPADARNYDPEVGKRYAYEDAFKKIWSHEGYLLRDKLSSTQAPNDASVGLTRVFNYNGFGVRVIENEGVKVVSLMTTVAGSAALGDTELLDTLFQRIDFRPGSPYNSLSDTMNKRKAD